MILSLRARTIARPALPARGARSPFSVHLSPARQRENPSENVPRGRGATRPPRVRSSSRSARTPRSPPSSRRPRSRSSSCSFWRRASSTVVCSRFDDCRASRLLSRGSWHDHDTSVRSIGRHVVMCMSVCRMGAIGSGVPYKETGQFAVVSEHGMPARLFVAREVVVVVHGPGDDSQRGRRKMARGIRTATHGARQGTGAPRERARAGIGLRASENVPC